jgi:hypothetical protein
MSCQVTVLLLLPCMSKNECMSCRMQRCMTATAGLLALRCTSLAGDAGVLVAHVRCQFEKQ